MAVYNVHAGHCPQGIGASGAVGILKESVEDRLVKDEVIRILRAEGNTAYDCTCDENTTQQGCLNKIIAKCNAHNVKGDYSIHLNSGKNDYKGDGKTGGIEVIIYDERMREIAERIANNISREFGYALRSDSTSPCPGVKINKNLRVLRETKAPAALIECCFVDDADDAAKWDYKKCALAIAEGILNKKMRKAEWKKNETGWWYERADGTYPASKWELISGDWYYFDDRGYALHDRWFAYGENWYYLKPDCRMAKGWLKDAGFWYYLNVKATKDTPQGAMLTGWQLVNGKWYYLRPEKEGEFPAGSAVKNWRNVDSYTYYFLPETSAAGPECSMLTGWGLIGGDWYYFNKSLNCQKIGSMLKNHWITDRGKKYYLKEDGKMARLETLDISGEEYSFAEDGSCVE